MHTPAQETPREPFSWLSHGVVMSGVALLFLVAVYLVYALKEDLQGAADWAKAKDRLKAADISIDPKDYLPAPIPAADNFGALPIFQFSTDPKTGAPKLTALRQATDPLLDNVYYPSFEKRTPGKILQMGNWPSGANPDLAPLKKDLEEYCRLATPPIPVPPDASPSEILGLICPVFAKLRAENQLRPRCSFDLGSTVPAPNNSDKLVEFAGGQIALAKAMAYEEVASVLDGHPQLALDDLKVSWKIGLGMRQEPALVDGLVYLGVTAIHRSAIQQGLTLHVWNDAQLKELDDGLGLSDFLAEAQFIERADFAVYMIPLNESYSKDPGSWETNSRRLAKESSITIKESFYFWTSLYLRLVPSGWYISPLADYATYLQPGKKQLLDLPTRRVFPDREAAFPPKRENPSGNSPPDEIFRNVAEKFSQAQVLTDEARIACRLERYRIAHGLYPDSLAAFEPAYGPLPHDIMNGEPYHYKLAADGTYVLYSVAWNQKDDGGNGGRGSPTLDSPDWVWTNKPVEKKK